MMQNATVLTGDLVASRKAGRPEVDAAMQALSDAAADFGRDHGHDLRFTRFRGDGWQVLVPDANLALEATLFLAARLRATGGQIDTRISIGIGPVDTPGSRDLSDASGPAFFTSGDHLEKIGRRQRLHIAGVDVGPWHVAVIDLLDHILAGWSAPQAEAVALALRSDAPTQDDIAAELGITRQAVQSRLAGAGFSFLDSAREAFILGRDRTPTP